MAAIRSSDIKLGYSCNNNCIHCVISSQKKRAATRFGRPDRTTTEYLNELTRAKERGVTHITVTGGEPTIRKDLPEILSFANQAGFKIGMQTNGRMFSIRKYAEHIAEIGVNSFVVALHGPDKETHDQITRARGSFEQTVEGIKNLKELGQHVSGKMVLSKKNYRKLTETIQLFVKLGVKKGNAAFPHAQGNAWENFDMVVPKYKEAEPEIRRAIEWMEKEGLKGREAFFDFEAIPFCFMDGKKKYMQTYRKFPQGCELNQFDGKGARDWNKIRKAIKAKAPQCKECVLFDKCEGVWEEYIQVNGHEEFKPIRPTEKNKEKANQKLSD